MVETVGPPPSSSASASRRCLTLVFTPALLAVRVWFWTILGWLARALGQIGASRMSRPRTGLGTANGKPGPRAEPDNLLGRGTGSGHGGQPIWRGDDEIPMGEKIADGPQPAGADGNRRSGKARPPTPPPLRAAEVTDQAGPRAASIRGRASCAAARPASMAVPASKKDKVVILDRSTSIVHIRRVRRGPRVRRRYSIIMSMEAADGPSAPCGRISLSPAGSGRSRLWQGWRVMRSHRPSRAGAGIQTRPEGFGVGVSPR